MYQAIVKSKLALQMLKAPVLLSYCEQLYPTGEDTIFISTYPGDDQIVIGAVKGIDLTAEIKEM